METASSSATKFLHEVSEPAIIAGDEFLRAMNLPGFAPGAIIGAAALFATGRILFFPGYERGAAARSLGFTLTFYPTALMLICAAVKSIFGAWN